jgi:outer membrane protein assembly factor BamB
MAEVPAAGAWSMRNERTMKQRNAKSPVMMFRAVLVPAALVWLVAATTAWAGDHAWPSFRGDQQMRGVARGSLPDQPEMHWRTETGAPINSSAVIADGRVFVGSDDGNIYALDLKTGEEIWKFPTEGPVGASPLYLRGKIFVGSQDYTFYCLNAEDGKEIWKFKTYEKILSAANWVDTATTAGTLIVFGSYDNNLYGVSAESGKMLWKYQTDNFVNGSAAIDRGRAIFGGCDGIIHIVSVDDGREQSQIDMQAYIAGTLAVDANKAYFGHYEHVFQRVDLVAKKTDWEYRDKTFPFFSSPALARDRVVFGGRDKRVHCVNRMTGEALWTFRTGGQVDSSPVVCGDRMVIGSDDGRLYILDLADGREVWSAEIGRKIFATPAVAQGMIVVGSNDGAVYAFGPPRPKQDR